LNQRGSGNFEGGRIRFVGQGRKGGEQDLSDACKVGRPSFGRPRFGNRVQSKRAPWKGKAENWFYNGVGTASPRGGKRSSGDKKPGLGREGGDKNGHRGVLGSGKEKI